MREMVIKLNMRLLKVQKGYFETDLKLPICLKSGRQLPLTLCLPPPLDWSFPTSLNYLSVTPYVCSWLGAHVSFFLNASYSPFAMLHFSFAFHKTPILTYHLSFPWSLLHLFWVNHLTFLSSSPTAVMPEDMPAWGFFIAYPKQLSALSQIKSLLKEDKHTEHPLLFCPRTQHYENCNKEVRE